MSRTPSRRSKAKSRRPLPSRRALRLARAEEPDDRRASPEGGETSGAGTDLEDPDPVGGPVGGESPSDDPSGGDWSPEPAVVGFPTVVPHHEPVTGGNPDRRGEVAVRIRAAGPYVGVLLPHTVASHVSFDDRDHVARARDDALDEVRAGFLRLRF